MTSLAVEQLRSKPSHPYAYEELDVEEPGAEEAGPRGGSKGHLNRTAGWAGWVCASLLLVAWVLREGLPMVRGPLLVPTSDACRDPFTNPLGYIWRGVENNEIQWLPYPDVTPNTTLISQEIGPPKDAFQLAAPSYNAWLEDAAGRGNDTRLAFMRDRFVVLIGDSHDRMNVNGFCQQHPGGVRTVPGFHLKSSCVIPDLNFTLASWFMFGLAEESQDWYARGDAGPWSVERRLADLFAKDGIPNLILFNSFYWDIRYFGQYAAHYNFPSSQHSYERPLTFAELAWHRTRLSEVIGTLRQMYPGVPIMFRLGQPHHTSANSGNIAVFQLNQSARQAMKELGVPIFEWATLLQGESGYTDDQHLKIGKQPAYLFGSMLLFYLARAVSNSC